MKADFMEKNHVIHVAPSSAIAANEDIYNGGIASDVVSLANASGAVFIIAQNANGSGGNATVEVLACSDVTPTTTTAISFLYREITSPNTCGAITETKGFATSTAADMVYVVEVDAQTLAASGYKYCQLRCTEKTNQAVDGGVVGFLTGMKYAQDVPPTQVV